MIFLADENIPLPAILALRRTGHNVRAIAEDAPGLGDEQVARLSWDGGCVLLTFDKDFGDIVFRPTGEPG